MSASMCCRALLRHSRLFARLHLLLVAWALCCICRLLMVLIPRAGRSRKSLNTTAGATIPPATGARLRSSTRKEPRAAIPSTKLQQLAVTHYSRRGFPTSQLSLVQQRASFSPPPVDVKKLLSSKTPSHRYTLHHRFYFHTDEGARLWLTAEVFHTPNLTPQPHTPNNDIKGWL